jgi:integrase
LLPETVRYAFNKLLKQAGFEHMKFHTLRHNASLILRKLGIDPVVRMEMLGHSSMEMTDGVYGHATPQMHQQAAKQLKRLFGSESD